MLDFKVAVVIVVAAVLIAVAVLAIILKKRKIGSESQETEKPSQEAINEMTAQAKSFTGLYEPLRMICDGRLKAGHDVFADWDARVSNMDESPALAQYWNSSYSGFDKWSEAELIRKAGELLAFTQLAGITRSDETEVTVERSIFRRYYAKDNVKLEPGTVAKVELTCWLIGNDVLEKGIITM